MILNMTPNMYLFWDDINYHECILGFDSIPPSKIILGDNFLQHHIVIFNKI